MIASRVKTASLEGGELDWLVNIGTGHRMRPSSFCDWGPMARWNFFFFPDLGLLQVLDTDGQTLGYWQVRTSRERGFRQPYAQLEGTLYLYGNLVIGHLDSEVFAVDYERALRGQTGLSGDGSRTMFPTLDTTKNGLKTHGVKTSPFFTDRWSPRNNFLCSVAIRNVPG